MSMKSRRQVAIANYLQSLYFKTMNIKQLNEFPISDFLSREGILPSKDRGTTLWYISPIRTEETTPSFKVDIKLNRWYDHGIGEGGKLFDLALRLYQTLDVRAVIDALNKHYALSKRTFTPLAQTKQKENTLVVLDIRPLGFNRQLVSYLQSRGIEPKTAEPYCNDVLFRVSDKIYYAIGFKNKSGGYELRNSFFKGSSSPKDVTIVNQNSNSVAVTEGFMDFLSLLSLKIDTKPQDFLILNSLSFVSRSLPLLRHYETVSLYLNNDNAGKRATESVLREISSANDNSSLFVNHKDLNDYLLQRSINVNSKPYMASTGLIKR